ncbi:hypothetical protein ABNN70_06410 [Sporolactobacillus sp. Y61]|uniref:MFS transporter n=1 Tax=Sporolactobacillus sp. Y61 TaxID=3160863 RepID=A0AAU8IIB8_9BACL
METERTLGIGRIRTTDEVHEKQYSLPERHLLEARINNLPATRTMYKVFTLITLGMVLDGFDVYLAGAYSAV